MLFRSEPEKGYSEQDHQNIFDLDKSATVNFAWLHYEAWLSDALVFLNSQSNRAMSRLDRARALFLSKRIKGEIEQMFYFKKEHWLKRQVAFKADKGPRVDTGEVN